MARPTASRTSPAPAGSPRTRRSSAAPTRTRGRMSTTTTSPTRPRRSSRSPATSSSRSRRSITGSRAARRRTCARGIRWAIRRRAGRPTGAYCDDRGVLPGQQLPRPPRSATPIGFDHASGNFEGERPGAGPDAATAPTPTAASRTPTTSTTRTWRRRPTASSPRMQMYLFADDAGDAVQLPDVNGGDDAGDRLPRVHARPLQPPRRRRRRRPAPCNAPQAGAMGEAWSDWYAMDLPGPRGPRDRRHRHATARSTSACYADARASTSIRTEALDCPVGRRRRGLPRRRHGRHRRLHATATSARVAGGPEVHADGEIWAQTLWDLRSARRDRRGTPARRAEQLITRGMELSPPEPSDARHAQRDPPGRPGASTAARDHDLDLGRCSRAAAWASSPPPSTAATSSRPRTSTCRPADGAPPGTLRGTVRDSADRRARSRAPSSRLGPAAAPTRPAPTGATRSPASPQGTWGKLAVRPGGWLQPELDVPGLEIARAATTTTRDPGARAQLGVEAGRRLDRRRPPTTPAARSAARAR